MKLSKNFSLHEFTKSEAAIRHGIDNTPSQTEIDNLKLVANNIAQPIRDKFGPTKINSGYRSPEVNSKIGGSKTSDHCKGMAIDLEVLGVPNGEIATWVKDNLKFTQLILEFYTPGIPDSGWVHVSYDVNNLKQEVLTAVKKGKKTVYKKGLIL